MASATVFKLMPQKFVVSGPNVLSVYLNSQVKLDIET